MLKWVVIISLLLTQLFLGYCNVGDDNWLGNAVTITSNTSIGNDNTLSSGEHLFEDMSNRQFFKHGIVTEKPEKQ